MVTVAPLSWANTELISFCTEVSGPALAVAPQSKRPRLGCMLVASVDCASKGSERSSKPNSDSVMYALTAGRVGELLDFPLPFHIALESNM